MTLEVSVHVCRLRVIARAHVLGNVSQACREVGISRTLFSRWRRRCGERLQGTILTELWRVEVRRRFFTHVRFLQAALDRYLCDLALLVRERHTHRTAMWDTTVSRRVSTVQASATTAPHAITCAMIRP